MEKKFIINGKEITVKDFSHVANVVSFSFNNKNYKFQLHHQGQDEVEFFGENRLRAFLSSSLEAEKMIILNGSEAKISELTPKLLKSKGVTGGLKSPMPGKIFKVIKGAGEKVEKGETILILEAMKMEHSIRADVDGMVKKINFKEGELVQGGVTLVELE
jgi:biotin carboxyl carrier protein